MPSKIILRHDPYLDELLDDAMEFKLTWAGSLLAHRNDKRLPQRSLAVHAIRRNLHVQLKKLRATHPTFNKKAASAIVVDSDVGLQIFNREGFRWLPIATKENTLICKLDILLLRNAAPGDVLADIDNRLKTIFDALKMPSGPQELGGDTSSGKLAPGPDEDPFLVLLEDDSLITHVSVSTDMLLEDVPNSPPDTAARLVIDVMIRPYEVTLENVPFT